MLKMTVYKVAHEDCDKAQHVTKAQATLKAAQALGAKVRRKYRSMAKNAERQEGIDRRTAAERGYDACVKVGVARAQAGTCIAAIAGSVA